MRKIEAAAGALQVQLQLVEVRSASEFERAFLAMARERADALILLPSPMLFSERTYRQSRHNASAASIAMAREFADLGGLLAYGASLPTCSAMPPATWT